MTGTEATRLPVPVEPDELREALDRWGICGVLGQQDLLVTGFALLAPDTPPAEPEVRPARVVETATLTAVWVHPDHRGRGLGRQLVQSAAAELVRREVTALEATGHRTVVGPELPDRIPVGFLEAVGFRVVHAHPTAPRLRMDLTTSVRWRPDLGAAWERLTGLVSKPIPAQPAGFQQQRQVERSR